MTAFTDLSSLASPPAGPTPTPNVPAPPIPIVPIVPASSPASPASLIVPMSVPVSVSVSPIGPVVPPAPVKPGIKTSEMYGNLLAGVLAVVVASGLITSNLWLQIAIIVGGFLTSLGYTGFRTSLKRAVTITGALLFVFSVGSTTIACTANARADTIHAALFTADAANATFVAYDRHRQATIVAEATSRVQGEAALTAYEITSAVSQARLERALVVLYRAIAVAQDVNDKPSLDTVAAALAQVALVLGQLTGGVL